MRDEVFIATIVERKAVDRIPNGSRFVADVLPADLPIHTVQVIPVPLHERLKRVDRPRRAHAQRLPHTVIDDDREHRGERAPTAKVG